MLFVGCEPSDVNDNKGNKVEVSKLTGANDNEVNQIEVSKPADVKDSEVEVSKPTNVKDNEVNQTEVSKPSDVDDSKVNKVEGGKPSSVSDYKIYEEEYTAYNKENNPFKVKYAQISGLGNENLESKINQTLKLSITEWINEDCEWAEKFHVEVTNKTSKYLSMTYSIVWDDSQGEESMSTYTRIGVTIDMQTGERVYLDDLVKDTDSLKQELQNYSYGNDFSAPIDSEEADKIVHYASMPEKEYLEEIYKTDPLVYSYTLSYLTQKPSFYLEDDKLAIAKNESDMNDVYIDFKQ